MAILPLLLCTELNDYIYVTPHIVHIHELGSAISSANIIFPE
jgi:hypothetical protein